MLTYKEYALSTMMKFESNGKGDCRNWGLFS